MCDAVLLVPHKTLHTCTTDGRTKWTQVQYVQSAECDGHCWRRLTHLIGKLSRSAAELSRRRICISTAAPSVHTPSTNTRRSLVYSQEATPSAMASCCRLRPSPPHGWMDGNRLHDDRNEDWFRLEVCTGMQMAGESRGICGFPAGMGMNVAGIPRGWILLRRKLRENGRRIWLWLVGILVQQGQSVEKACQSRSGSVQCTHIQHIIWALVLPSWECSGWSALATVTLELMDGLMFLHGLKQTDSNRTVFCNV